MDIVKISEKIIKYDQELVEFLIDKMSKTQVKNITFKINNK